MLFHRKYLLFITAGLLGWVLLSTPSMVNAQKDFTGKSFTMIVGWDPGGRIDRQGRTVAKYLKKHLPGNPDFIIQNIPGGKGIPSIQRFLRSKADGSVMMMQTSRGLETVTLVFPKLGIDPLKYSWVGSVSTGKQRNTLFTHKQAGFKTLEDLNKKQIILGAQRVGHRSYLYGRLIAEIMNFNVRWVIGYSTSELDLAIDRGEVDGRVNDAASMFQRRPNWVNKKLIVPHIAVTLPEKLPPMDHPLFAKVPSLMNFTKDEVQRAIIRKFNTTDSLSSSLALPPGSPESVRSALETALMKVGKDPGFIKDWESFVLPGTPFGGTFSSKAVLEAVRIYVDWNPKVLKEYNRLGYEPPK